MVSGLIDYFHFKLVSQKQLLISFVLLLTSIYSLLFSFILLLCTQRNTHIFKNILLYLFKISELYDLYELKYTTQN